MDQKTSLLINRQVPDFVRDEYPLFVNFLEAYYEFLEQKQNSQLNDLTEQAKKLRYISDVDESVDQFADNFLNTYANLIPRDAVIDKSLMIKNLLPLYLAKGSPKSFNLLFRILFGEEVIVSYPIDNILRPSSSKWVVENALNISSTVYSYYTADGLTTTFKLLQECDATDIQVYVDGILIDSSNFIIYKLYKKIVFNTAPVNGSFIKIYYNSFDEKLLLNRKLIGIKSLATGIVERVDVRVLNNKKTFQLYLNAKTVFGTFNLGENVNTDVLVDGVVVDVLVKSISELQNIIIVNKGANYNVGDPVPISVTAAEKQPAAYISKVGSTTIDKITVVDGGAGFQVNSNVFAYGDSSYYPLINIHTSVIYSESPNTSNVFKVFSDTIDSIDANNINIGDADYTLVNSANVNSNIYLALSNTTYTNIGEISGVDLTQCLVTFSKSPDFQAFPSYYTFGSTPVYINEFGSLGKIVIWNGGQNYVKGDELVFTNKPMSFGYGAEAEVMAVDVNGTITNVDFVPPKITGNVAVSNISLPTVSGTGTKFSTELSVGQMIMINGQTRNVAVITSDTSLNVDSNFTQTFSNKPIRLYGLGLVGGQGYTQDLLPNITVNSSTGSNANITVTAIFGDGEVLDGSLGTNKPGQIEEIIIIDPGQSLDSQPAINLQAYGDGTATANAILFTTYESYSGKWITHESILSENETRIQGRNYYINYSYVLTSPIEFSKYKKLLKNLLHPAGHKYYSILTRNSTIDTTGSQVESGISKQISGRVNVTASSITVTGTNTKFNIANSSGVLTIGDTIVVNTQIRIVDSIVDNTHINVTSVFANTSNEYVLTVI